MKSHKKTIVLVALALVVVCVILYYIWPCFRVSPEWVSAIATSISAVAVIFAMLQLITTKNIAQLQFEDALEKEYRDLVSRIPTKALLGSGLSPIEYEAAFDELFRYVDLSNEQVLLRMNSRVSPKTWENWCEGIRANLQLPIFERAWKEIKEKSSSFQELRKLETEKFLTDPATWS